MLYNRNFIPSTLSAFFVTFFLLHHVITSQQQAQRKLKDDEFHEDLYLTPLPDGKLYAHFQFRTLYRKDIKSLRWENKIEIFPLSVVDLVATTDLQELHFSLTKGNWHYNEWGYPVRSSPPGAQILARFSQHNENLNRSWQKLVNSLAGKFCASLMSADHTVLTSPKLALNACPSQAISSLSLNSSLDNVSGGGHCSQGRFSYSNLPDEILCTQNLTPWKKLLPCYSNSGLATLLNAVNIFKSSFSSLSIDLEPKQCVDEDGDAIVGCDQVQLTQSISIVFNPLLQFEGRQSWSLIKTFGNKIHRQCYLTSHSNIYVDISDPNQKDKLYPQEYQESTVKLKSGLVKRYAVFNLSSILGNDPKLVTKQSLNVGIKQDRIFKRQAFSSRKAIPISLKTHIAGIGAADGTIVAIAQNSMSEPIRVFYMDVIPYFMRVYLHTLTIRTSSGQELKPDKLNFDLSSGETPTLIEFSLKLPANDEVQISYDFERAFLDHSKFKPGASRGILLGSSMMVVPIAPLEDNLVMPICTANGRLISTMLDGDANITSVQLVGLEDHVLRIYSKPLLVILPMPDFTMSYNVLCLVTTVLVSAFGPLYNMTTRKPMIQISKRAKKKSASSDNDVSEVD